VQREEHVMVERKSESPPLRMCLQVEGHEGEAIDVVGRFHSFSWPDIDNGKNENPKKQKR
jgi:hypothetical protein